MKLTFLGGADEVGASSLLLEMGGKRFLVDAGLRPSPKARAGLAGDQMPHLEAITDINAILVTHAHTDHTGVLELVTARFPGVPVYATPATIALTRVLHQDSRRIMQSRLDEEGELPLFDDLAVERLMSSFVPVPFNTRLTLAKGLAVTFFPAGHIAGAAMLGFESEEGQVLITGDVSISPQRTVDGARLPAFRPDILVIESTYGGRLHANRSVQERKLVETVARVTAEGGKVLIPAFALGRAQEILLILGEYQRRGLLPALPVWADGMVRSICQAYSSFSDVLPLALQERGARFFEGAVRPVQSSEQRNALIWQPDPLVIVASSGMLAGGPSLSYARALASSPQHAILLTGYQDEESPGRKLQEMAEKGSGSIRLGPDKVDVQCHLATYSLSAHADEGQLISLVETLAPEHVVLVHGDGQARLSLEKALLERHRIVHLPEAGQTMEFHFQARKPANTQVPAGEDLRARQIGLGQQRRARILELGLTVGKWLLLKGDPPVPVRCLALESDHLWVEIAPGLEQAAYPEEILTLLGERAPTQADLAPYRPPTIAPAVMEPNQALAFANQHFPAQARLRKVGYRLAEHVLVINFDFPEAAIRDHAGLIASLQSSTGWQVEVTAETNQAALNTRVRELLPNGWHVTRGPAIYRAQKRVTITISGDEDLDQQEKIQQRFRAETGYALEITRAAQASAPVILPVAYAGERLEINAAYLMIKTALEGSTLYRTSLKGDEIVLSFISPQVGERYREQVQALALQTGWQLAINPSPNQGAILETARALIQGQEWTLTKGPGIYPEKAEVVAALAESIEPASLTQVAETFLDQTGFRLSLSSPQTLAPSPDSPANRSTSPALQPAVTEIPVKLIRLSRYQQTLNLDPARLEKAVERARRLGITPPITVRRAREDYMLLDGLYRLRAAEALGMERIPAVVE